MHHTADERKTICIKYGHHQPHKHSRCKEDRLSPAHKPPIAYTCKKWEEIAMASTEEGEKPDRVSRSWFTSAYRSRSPNSRAAFAHFHGAAIVFVAFARCSFVRRFAFIPEPDLWPTFSSALQRSLNQLCARLPCAQTEGDMQQKFLFYRVIFHLAALDFCLARAFFPAPT